MEMEEDEEEERGGGDDDGDGAIILSELLPGREENIYIYIYIYIYISEVGGVRAALALPLTGKSISIALAFALRACVRASEAASARRFLCGWGSACEFVGRPSVVRRPSGRPSR